MSDYHYHYNREERTALKHQPAREPVSGNIFRRNRSLAIVVLDVMILLLVFGIWWAFMRTPSDSVMVNDYRFELTGGISEGDTYAVLTVRNDGEDRSAALFDARFESAPDAEAAAERSEILPMPGDVEVVRVRWQGSYEELRATVRWRDGSAEIQATVR